jgi:NTE family protein
LILSACQSFTTKHQQADRSKEGSAVITTSPVTATPEETPVPIEVQPTPPPYREAPSLPVPSQRPRLALILGPGGLRSFAHAGMLQEIAKAKIPVYWIGGLEMGALPAALFALKGQPFEAEWQMMKLKEEDLVHSGILTGTAPLKADTLGDPLKLMFGSSRVEDAKISMMCSSYSLPKRQTFLMNRGPFWQMLQYCLPASPLFEPFQGNGANPMALASLAQVARQKGAQLLVYVDLLSDNSVGDNEEGFLWGLFQQGIEAQSRAVNETFKIGGLSGLRAFDKRREMLQKGQEAGRRLVQLLQTKYGY